MLVPDMRVVPPPSRVDRIPTELIKQARLTFSASSPGAETTTPAPSVVKNDAVSAPIGALRKRHWLEPAVAVVLATAMTSGYAAGIIWLISADASLPAATTTATPAATRELSTS